MKLQCHRCFWPLLALIHLELLFIYLSVTSRLALPSSRDHPEVVDSPAASQLAFPEAIRRVYSYRNGSIYRFDRTRNLAVMKLTADERHRSYRIRQARSWLRTQHLVVAAAVRNALPGLRSTMGAAQLLSQVFGSMTLVFVENDSSDGTREYLYNLSTRANSSGCRVFLLGCGYINSPDPCHLDISYGSSGRRHQPGHWEQANRTLEEESVDRGMVMAALRNIYLQFIYDHLSADLLLVLEADLNWQTWSQDAVMQGLYYFKAKPQLDVLCAFTMNSGLHDPCTLIFHQAKLFYVNAYETDAPFIDRIGWYPNRWFLEHLSPPSTNGSLPREPVKVAACFQGAAFYRLRSLARPEPLFHRYSEGEWHCEHSTLARQLREVYLDPQMILHMDGQRIG